MIDVSLHTPIQDPSVYQFPLDLVSELLQRVSLIIEREAAIGLSKIKRMKLYIESFTSYQYI